jgi:hypothetical protein
MELRMVGWLDWIILRAASRAGLSSFLSLLVMLSVFLLSSLSWRRTDNTQNIYL